MQFKSLLVAVGFAAVTTAVAIPEPQLETRAVSAPFKIQRFTPLANFNPAVVGTWSNNQYTNISTVNKYLDYDGVTAETAFFWTLSTEGLLRGSPSATASGLAARNQQDYGITFTPITFGGVGEVAKVTVGPAPLFEVKFQSVNEGLPVGPWTTLGQVDKKVFLGKTGAITQTVRFRAIGYTAPV
ncbi:hypothetical protein VTL71DRAFT_4796 [Oculimacula yallundae]|uniref:Uncharacterized protein n=1 Tax=Oculimacula yallundae TaxID=86028 RepID=A0ABR4C3M6_9HELO